MKTDCESPIPMDSFIQALPKRSCVCVGAFLLSTSYLAVEKPATEDLVFRIARSWSMQTKRSSCVIASETIGNEESSEDANQVASVSWSWLEQETFDPGVFSKQLARDVAGLSRIRSHHALVMIDLGSIDSRAALYASKLCDGLVLLADDEASIPERNQDRTRGMRQSLSMQLKAIQSDDCPWLGYWSLARAKLVGRSGNCLEFDRQDFKWYAFDCRPRIIENLSLVFDRIHRFVSVSIEDLLGA